MRKGDLHEIYLQNHGKSKFSTIYIYVVSILAFMSIWWLGKSYTEVSFRCDRTGWHIGSLADFKKAKSNPLGFPVLVLILNQF